jgi:cytochrome c-type biogenesis protein CcmH/NrfG
MLIILFACGATALPDQEMPPEISVGRLLGAIVENPDDARYADVAAAIEQFNSGDLEGTRVMLEEAASKLPELAPADAMMAQLLFLGGRPQAARSALEAATAASPNDPEAYLMLGDVALREGRVTEAQLLYSRAETLCAAYDKNARRRRRMLIGAYSGTSAAASARELWDDVSRAVDAWLKIDPQSAEANLRLGRAKFHQSDLQGAYTTFQQAHQIDASTPQPEVSMGLLYEDLARRGDTDKHANAKRAMQAAVQADPDTLNTRLAVARWALDSCEIDLAAENAEAALKLSPDSVEAMLLAALAARHRASPDKAVQLLQAAHLQAPGNPMILAQLALALLEAKKPQATTKALNFARLAVAAGREGGQPDAGDAGVALAWALFQTGRQGEAEAALQSAMQSGPLSDESAYYAAAILNAGGRDDVARQLLRSSLAGGVCFPARKAAEALAEKL